MKHPSYTTHEEMRRVVVESILPKVPYSVTKVVGVPRSGLVPAMVVAFSRHIELGAIGVGTIGGGERTLRCMPKDDGDVLLIDDALSRGRNMALARKSLEDNGRRVITASVFIAKGGEGLVDIFGAYKEHPRLFEWNLFNHGLGPCIMFDMDGVLCKDPEPFDDDGLAYQEALRNASPLVLPKWPIGVICTNRIERWRGITEEWLKRHGVNYRALLMNPALTAEDRRKNPMAHKVKSYSKSGALLFVESSTHQATQIAEKTGRPVLSFEENRLY